MAEGDSYGSVQPAGVIGHAKRRDGYRRTPPPTLSPQSDDRSRSMSSAEIRERNQATQRRRADTTNGPNTPMRADRPSLTAILKADDVLNRSAPDGAEMKLRMGHEPLIPLPRTANASA